MYFPSVRTSAQNNRPQNESPEQIPAPVTCECVPEPSVSDDEDTLSTENPGRRPMCFPPRNHSFSGPFTFTNGQEVNKPVNWPRVNNLIQELRAFEDSQCPFNPLHDGILPHRQVVPKQKCELASLGFPMIDQLLKNEDLVSLLTLKNLVTSLVIKSAQADIVGPPELNTTILTCPSLDLLHPGWEITVFDSFEWGNLQGSAFDIPSNPNLLTENDTEAMEQSIFPADGAFSLVDCGQTCVEQIENSVKYQYPREFVFFMKWNKKCANEAYYSRYNQDTELKDKFGNLLSEEEIKIRFAQKQLEFFDEYLAEYQDQLIKERAFLDNINSTEILAGAELDKLCNDCEEKYGIENPATKSYKGYEPSFQLKEMMTLFYEKTKEAILKQSVLRLGYDTIVHNDRSPSYTLKPITDRPAENGFFFVEGLKKNVQQLGNNNVLMGLNNIYIPAFEISSNDSNDLNAPTQLYNEMLNPISYFQHTMYNQSEEPTYSYHRSTQDLYLEASLSSNSVLKKRQGNAKIEQEKLEKTESFPLGHPERPLNWESHTKRSEERDLIASLDGLKDFLKNNSYWFEKLEHKHIHSRMKEIVASQKVYIYVMGFTAGPNEPHQNADIMKDLVLLALIRANMVLGERKDPRRLLSPVMKHKLKYGPDKLLDAGNAIMEEYNNKVAATKTYIAQGLTIRTELVKELELLLFNITDCGNDYKNQDRETKWITGDQSFISTLPTNDRINQRLNNIIKTEGLLLKNWRRIMYYHTRLCILGLATNLCSMSMDCKDRFTTYDQNYSSDTLCRVFSS